MLLSASGALVYPAALLIYTAKQHGAYIFEININETEITSFTHNTLIGKAGELLPQILSEIKS